MTESKPNTAPVSTPAGRLDVGGLSCADGGAARSPRVQPATANREIRSVIVGNRCDAESPNVSTREGFTCPSYECDTARTDDAPPGNAKGGPLVCSSKLRT